MRTWVITAAVLHDLTLAASFCHRVVVLSDGGVVAEGNPNEVLTVELIREVWGVEVEVLHLPTSGSPVIVPIR
jgi:iron complex transport system ATP-binding protein